VICRRCTSNPPTIRIRGLLKLHNSRRTHGALS
jgi:hypothetical protein